MTAFSNGGNISSQISRTYNSFSGCDIHATFAGVQIGELQGVSYTVTREKAPIYTMGSVDCRGYSRGKRGIAGSLVFAVFDRTALLDTLRKIEGQGKFVTDATELAISGRRTTDQRGSLSGAGTNSLTQLPNVPEGDSFFEVADAWYLDQLPPFNIVLNAVNEYGHRMRKTIWNVEILNSGSGISIDDIMIDESMTFVATHITPWETGNFGGISAPITGNPSK